jgi:magnesium-dependent phosphatase-1
MEKIIFIFELDFTLWDCDKVKHYMLKPPFKKKMNSIVDVNDKKITPYPEIFTILEQIKEANYGIVLTAKTRIPEHTREFVKLAGLSGYPDITIFNDDTKKDQLASLMTLTDIPPSKIIYFDSNPYNIEQVKPFGIHTFLIPDEGLTYDTFLLAMKNASFTMEVDRLGITWGTK